MCCSAGATSHNISGVISLNVAVHVGQNNGSHSLEVCACEMRFAMRTGEGRLFIISSYNRDVVPAADAAATPNALWLGSLCVSIRFFNLKNLCLLVERKSLLSSTRGN